MSELAPPITDVAFKALRMIDWDGMLSFWSPKRFAKSSHLFVVPSMRLIQLFRQVQPGIFSHFPFLTNWVGSLCSLKLGFFVLTFFPYCSTRVYKAIIGFYLDPFHR